MSQIPAPVPRAKVIPLKSVNQVPQSPTESPEGDAVRPIPPPVLPRNYSVKRIPGGSENGCLEIVPVTHSVTNNRNMQPAPLPAQTPNRVLHDAVVVSLKQSFNKNCNTPPALPPPIPLKQKPDEDILDDNALMSWWEKKQSWDLLCKGLDSPRRTEIRIIKIKAEPLHKAIQVYILLLTKHIGTLKEHTAELLCIADNLDAVSKKTKIAGITGGATSVVGGVAAAAGVILSPFTMGASLALTVAGVGVAAAGGVTGASAAIAHKVSTTNDKKKIDKIFQEYDKPLSEIRDCLVFISEGMKRLKQHDLSVLSEARKTSVRMASVVDLATTGGTGARALEVNSKASGLIEGFALGMDFFFTQGKDGQTVKKGLESKFAKKIRKLAEDLNKGLDEFMQTKDVFSKNCPRK